MASVASGLIRLHQCTVGLPSRPEAMQHAGAPLSSQYGPMLQSTNLSPTAGAACRCRYLLSNPSLPPTHVLPMSAAQVAVPTACLNRELEDAEMSKISTPQCKMSLICQIVFFYRASACHIACNNNCSAMFSVCQCRYYV